jgi:hypothetical protein
LYRDFREIFFFHDFFLGLKRNFIQFRGWSCWVDYFDIKFFSQEIMWMKSDVFFEKRRKLMEYYSGNVLKIECWIINRILWRNFRRKILFKIIFLLKKVLCEKEEKKRKIPVEIYWKSFCIWKSQPKNINNWKNIWLKEDLSVAFLLNKFCGNLKFIKDWRVLFVLNHDGGNIEAFFGHDHKFNETKFEWNWKINKIISK